MRSISFWIGSFILCVLCPLASAAPFNTGQTNQYPRFLSTLNGDNEILAIDAHFPSDTMVLAGRSNDQYLKENMNWFTHHFNPIVAAMSIDSPIYKWAKYAKDIPNK
jgi:hypothetical protein